VRDGEFRNQGFDEPGGMVDDDRDSLTIVRIRHTSPPPVWHTVLAVDAMYFHAARQTHAKGVASVRGIERAEKRVARHQEKIDAINEMFSKDEIDASRHYDKLEPLAIQMESVEYGVGTAYGLLLEHVGMVHILSAAALEAHINFRADQVFSGRLWNAFEHLSLDAKWLFLPRVLGLAGFETGAEPFQGFDQLIKIRNRLVHYKTRREPWRGSAAPPEFLVDLSLTIEAAEQSLAAVKGMTTELAKQLGEKPPWWLASEGSNFFEIQVERPAREGRLLAPEPDGRNE